MPARRGPIDACGRRVREDRTMVRAVLITGAPGAGKSSLLEALSALLEQRGLAHGAIESEELWRGHPMLGAEDWPSLAAVLARQRAAGRRLFVVVATTETHSDLQAACDACEADQTLVVCLAAPAEAAAARVAAREPEDWAGREGLIAHARRLAGAIPELDGIDLVLDSTDSDPRALARRLLREMVQRGFVAGERETAHVTLREFLPADDEALMGWIGSARELVRFGGPRLRWPLDRPQLEELRGHPMRLCWTVLLDGHSGPAGHVELMLGEGNGGHMGRVIIDPSLRGRGLGSALTDAVLGQAHERGLEQVTLNVFADNTPAIAAYRRCGFELDPAVDVRPGVVRMVCRLAG